MSQLFDMIAKFPYELLMIFEDSANPPSRNSILHTSLDGLLPGGIHFYGGLEGPLVSLLFSSRASSYPATSQPLF